MTDLDVWGEDAPVGRRSVLLDVAGAVLLALLGILAGTAQSSWSVGAAVLLSLALAVRRLSWPAALGLSVLGGVCQIAGGDVNVVADLAYAPVAFTMGAHRSARVRRLGVGSALVGVVIAGVWAATETSGREVGIPRTVAGGFVMGGLAALVLFGGWVTGYLRWQRREAVRARVAATLQSAEERRLQGLVAQEQERARIAADMHDVVAHSWAVVAAQADGARYQLRTDPDSAEAALAVIGETARTAMTDVRHLLTRLREPGVAADDLGFERPEELVGRMRASGMALDVRRSGEPSSDPGLAVVTRRVLAESLTNALKHGDLSQPVRVEEDWRDGYRLAVSNAADPRAARRSDGHGLVGMAERVEGSGGTMSAGFADGPCWVVLVEIPSVATQDAP